MKASYKFLFNVNSGLYAGNEVELYVSVKLEKNPFDCRFSIKTHNDDEFIRKSELDGLLKSSNIIYTNDEIILDMDTESFYKALFICVSELRSLYIEQKKSLKSDQDIPHFNEALESNIDFAHYLKRLKELIK